MYSSPLKRLFIVISCLSVFSKAEPKFPLDFDDADFYLTSRKGGPPSAVIEDIRRGQEGVLVKLRQVTNELENDELKLNNIFYKLGHHDTELKSINNGIGRLMTTGRNTETKLNKHAFNVEFLHRQLKELQTKLNAQETHKTKVLSLQKTVDHLEDRLSEALYRLSTVENSTGRQKGAPSPLTSMRNGETDLAFAGKANSLFHYPLRDQGACTEGWQLYEGYCFFISLEKKSFKGAIASCASKGSHLLSLTEAKRDIFLRKFIDSGEQSYWTSATDIFSPNQWSFLMSGDSIPRSMWSKPLGGYLTSLRNEHCAVIGKDGLESVKCGRRFSFICESL